MMTHLVIAGHGIQRDGSFDPGATGFITKGEHKYVVEDLFPAMKRHLPKNHNVVFYHKNKVSNFGNLASLVRQYGANQVTEIHFDAASSSARRGHVIIHSNFKPDKVDLALRDAIKNMVGVRYSHKGYSGISGRSNLYNVNVAKSNNISYRLIELGFGTNREDANTLTSKVDDYAKELVKAITGSVSSNPSAPPKPSKPASKPSKPRPYTQDAKYPKKGNYGSNVLKIQKLLNKAGYKVTEDSSFGPAMDKAVRRFQKAHSLAVDGQAGPKTQKALNSSSAKKTNNQIAEDGWWGNATTEKAQEVYGLNIVDGEVSGQPKNFSTRNIPAAKYGTGGSNLIFAMQKEFGVPKNLQDKIITDPSTLVHYMQKHYGTTQDKRISGPSLVIKEWQKALNKGKRK